MSYIWLYVLAATTIGILLLNKHYGGRYLRGPWSRYGRVPPKSAYNGMIWCSCAAPKRIDNAWRDYCANCGCPTGTKRGGKEKLSLL